MKTESLDDLYSNSFYDGQIEGSGRSADIILGLLFESYRPESMLDIGCGTGAWLKAAEKLGVRDLSGIDGVWAEKYLKPSESINFMAQDLETHVEIGRKYDLCMSVEVAEHLSESRALNFIQALCGASDVVLFGAAIKFQGGKNHINEQWQSYWVKLFEENSFKCLDLIRPCIWNNDDVECWYKQNIFLFVKEPVVTAKFRLLENSCEPLYDIVHPTVLQVKTERFRSFYDEPNLRSILRSIRQYIRKRFNKSE